MAYQEEQQHTTRTLGSVRDREAGMLGLHTGLLGLNWDSQEGCRVCALP